MGNAVYIAGLGPHSGKSVVAIGLVDMLLEKAEHVAYYKPVSRSDNDVHIKTILKHFGLPLKQSEVYACSWEQAAAQWKSDTREIFLDLVIRRFRRLSDKHELTVVEGSDYAMGENDFEFEMNVQMAKNLQAQMIIVTTAEAKTPAEVVSSLLAALHNLKTQKVTVLAVIVNKTAPGQHIAIQHLLTEQLPPGILHGLIADDVNLRSPTIGEITRQMRGRLLSGKEGAVNHADNFLVGVMQVPHFLTCLKKNTLVITSADRDDIILSASQANLSTGFPRISGILLTAGRPLHPFVLKMINASKNAIPVILVRADTFAACLQLAAVRTEITPGDVKKIELAVSAFKTAINADELEKRIGAGKTSAVTPLMFRYQLTALARRKRKHIVLPEGTDERILRATAKLVAAGLVKITLFGAESDIRARTEQLDIDLDMAKVNVIDPIHHPDFDDFADTLYKLRKHRGLTAEAARDLMADSSYFGTMLVYKGYADGMVSGAINTTSHTIRPALQFIKTTPGISLVSSVFLMCLPDRVCIFGDCAINPNPAADALADIAIAAAGTATTFGITPRIAMLSYSSGASGAGRDVERVRLATSIVRQKRPDLKIEGPIQYDAAVDPTVGRLKMPGSEVAGQATILIFPELDSGNNIYKAVQRETGAVAIGPILQGLKKPVNDLSRGCTAEDVYNTVLVTAIQSQFISG